MANFASFQLKNQLNNLYLVGYDSDTGTEIRIPASILTPQPGEPGAGVQRNYSVNGEEWHTGMQEGDEYFRDKVGSGEWTAAIPLGGEPGEQGLAGADGRSIYTGTTAPSSSAYSIGDLYLNTANFNLYQKTEYTVWTLKGNIRGFQGFQGIQGNNGSDGQRGTLMVVGSEDKDLPAEENTYPNDIFIDNASGRLLVADAEKNWNLKMTILLAK
ncbi:MAG: hypothetical protein LBU51_10225 [Bacteroidales bacterium]|jgi:hypothetical protein|nr:hypothetical protein [Bacteroidales bacterium]